jgi:uncharacterized protein
MRVLIDTNVVVSAALKDRIPEQIIRFIASQPNIQWIASAEIVAEYKAVLGRAKFALPIDLLHRWFTLFDALVAVVPVRTIVDYPRDQKDAKFLACALAAEADFLVTGDRDFSGATKFGHTTIVSVSQFNRLICQEFK